MKVTSSTISTFSRFLIAFFTASLTMSLSCSNDSLYTILYLSLLLYYLTMSDAKVQNKSQSTKGLTVESHAKQKGQLLEVGTRSRP